MTFNSIFRAVFAVAVVFATLPLHAGDIISCDSFESCPDGSDPLHIQIRAMQAEIDELKALLAGVSRAISPATGQDTLIFSDMNVQVVNGTNSTDGDANGTGNLIIGYNEIRGGEADVRTGSHMLVIGKFNNYSSHGGQVVGFYNSTSGMFSSVSGGGSNSVPGHFATISGGISNVAQGTSSSISGGNGNMTSAPYTSISGGNSKTAGTEDCTVAGEVGTDCL